LSQNAVLTKPDPVKLFIRLEMDVGRALLDRVEHHLVDEAHDRRIVDVRARDLAADGVVITAGYLEVLQVEIVFLEARHRRVDGLDRPADSSVELVLLDDERFDAKGRLKLDFVQRLEVRWVTDGDIEPLAPLQER